MFGGGWRNWLAGVILLQFIVPVAAGAVDFTPISRKAKVTFITARGRFDFSAEVAEKAEQLSRGLMYRPSLEKNAGMLFVFPDSARRYFWMKNTLIPLDIIFVSASRQVVYIVHQAEPCREPACRIYDSIKPAQYVMEINAGLSRKMGLKHQDRLEFDLSPPSGI